MKPGEPLEELHRHVADHGVAHAHVGHVLDEVAALDVADEVEACRPRPAVAWPAGRPASPLPFSSPIERRRDARLRHAQNLLGVDGAHVRRTGTGCGRSSPCSRRCRAGRTGPTRVGIWTASAGRSTPGTRPSLRTAAAIPAPLWPAVTSASARPCLSRSIATMIDESFFALSAQAPATRPSPRPGWPARSRRSAESARRRTRRCARGCRRAGPCRRDGRAPTRACPVTTSSGA